MAFWGKTVGAFLGFLLIGDNLVSNLFGIALGIGLGHLFDRIASNNVRQYFYLYGNALSVKEKQECFFDSTFSVMGHIAKTKDQVTVIDIQVANVYLDLVYIDEKNAIDSEFNLLNALQTTKYRMKVRRAFVEGKGSELLNSLQTTKHCMRAHSAFAEGKHKNFLLNKALKKLILVVGHNKNVLQVFLGIQIQLAYNGGELNNRDKDALYNIGAYLGFSRFEINRLVRIIGEQQHFYQDKPKVNEDDFYIILGIPKTASSHDIKLAYRKLMSQHHPDKLASKGLPEDVMQEAKEKTQNIQRAYNALRK
ncbi:MAG: DnaJ domain-containing protein [Psychromonas sp.]